VLHACKIYLLATLTGKHSTKHSTYHCTYSQWQIKIYVDDTQNSSTVSLWTFFTAKRDMFLRLAVVWFVWITCKSWISTRVYEETGEK